MKRYILIVAAVALATVSCSRNYDVNPAGEGTAIGFGTWAENLTKAARQPGSSSFTESGYQDNDFNVYGYKTLSGTPTQVFNGDVVSTTDGTSWTYSNTRYWDVNASDYAFFAVSPAGKVASATATTGAITTSTITFAGNNEDILVANKETVTTIPAPSAVELDFNHVASLVDINVKKSPALSNATVTISAFALENIEDDGALTIAAANYTDGTGVLSVASSDWGTDDGTLKAYLPANGITPVYGDTNTSGAISNDNRKTIAKDPAFNATTPATPTGSTALITGLIVKPQAFDNTKTAALSQKVTFTYQIASGGGDVNEYSATLWLADFDDAYDNAQDDTKVGSWEPGKHYIFYITIDANAIEFSARISDWTAGTTGYNYLLN